VRGLLTKVEAGIETGPGWAVFAWFAVLLVALAGGYDDYQGAPAPEELRAGL
jgi:hypothetical protein